MGLDKSVCSANAQLLECIKYVMMVIVNDILFQVLKCRSPDFHDQFAIQSFEGEAKTNRNAVRE